MFYRVNAQSRVLEEVLGRYGVPNKVIGTVRFYERREIKDVLAYLRLVCNPDDGISARRIINRPRRGIGRVTIGHLDRFAEAEEISFFAALGRLDEIHALASRSARAVRAFLTLFERVAERAGEGPVAAVRAVLEDAGYLDWVQEAGTFEAQVRVENLQELVSGAQEFEQLSQGKT